MVGQLENSLMPWRTSGAFSTSTALNFTPTFDRICPTAAENPHCGNTGVPFMNSTTALDAMSLAIRSWVVSRISFEPRLSLHHGGAAAERVKRWRQQVVS